MFNCQTSGKTIRNDSQKLPFPATFSKKVVIKEFLFSRISVHSSPETYGHVLTPACLSNLTSYLTNKFTTCSKIFSKSCTFEHSIYLSRVGMSIRSDSWFWTCSNVLVRNVSHRSCKDVTSYSTDKERITGTVSSVNKRQTSKKELHT